MQEAPRQSRAFTILLVVAAMFYFILFIYNFLTGSPNIEFLTTSLIEQTNTIDILLSAEQICAQSLSALFEKANEDSEVPSGRAFKRTGAAIPRTSFGALAAERGD